MWHKLNVVCSYMLAMLLGIYIATEWKFHQPVEMYRWIATALLFAAMVMRITYKEK